MCHALLYLKGYHSIQAYRIAHALWNRGQKILAVALQSRMSEVRRLSDNPPESCVSLIIVMQMYNLIVVSFFLNVQIINLSHEIFRCMRWTSIPLRASAKASS